MKKPDYFRSREKLVKGNEWRGEITVTIDDEDYQWTVRQLEDDEYYDVIADIDRKGLRQFREEVDQDRLDRYRELRDKKNDLEEDEELSDEEQEELEELRDEFEDMSILDRIDKRTFNAVRRAGRYGVVPSEEDVNYVMNELTKKEIGEMFGVTIEGALTPDDVYDILKEDMKERLKSSTDFVSFEVGLQVLNSTMEVEEDEGN